MKKERQAAIYRLVTSETITTQEMLQERLARLGYHVTQATLSRDIRELKLHKERRGKTQACYTVSVPQTLPAAMGDMIHGAVLRTDYAGNLAVIHCRTGTAAAIGVTLDGLQRDDVVGTIAGDDTVFVLLRTETQAREFALSFADFITRTAE